MRLTIINQFYVPDISPTAHLAASLAEHRVERGDQVTVVASRGGYVPESPVGRGDRDDNPRMCRVWTPRLGKANFLKRCIDYGTFYVVALWRVMTLPRQDVIVSLTTPPFVGCIPVFHKFLHRRTKLVLWNMDCYPEIAEACNVIKPGGVLSRAMRILNRWMFKRLDHLVCLDAAMARLLTGSYGHNRRTPPVTVIPNWEKASFIPPDLDPPEWDGAEVMNQADRFVVLYIGNVGYGHGFDTVIEAATMLANEPVTFLFVGGGSRFESLQCAVDEAGLTNVVLHGYVSKDQTPAVMNIAQCALITLRDRALGVISPSKLHANLAMRLPVIYVGPATSNVDEAIVRFGCGISLRHGDVDQLVDFIRRIRRDPQHLRELQRKARSAFEQAYCDVQTLPQFDRVIDGLASES